MSSQMRGVIDSPDSIADELASINERALSSGHDGLALFLDIDGTLTDFQDDPEHVRICKGSRLSNDLEALRGTLKQAMAVCTARDVESADRVMDGMVLPGAFEHGAVIRYDDQMTHILSHLPDFDAVKDDIKSAMRALPGSWLEQKAVSLALHWRECVESHNMDDRICQKICEDIARETICKLSSRQADEFHHLHTHLGAHVLEISPAVTRQGHIIDKGAGILALMQTPPFKNRIPVFFGDSPSSDGPAFKAVQDLGGFAIGVGSRVRDQNVDFLLADVDNAQKTIQKLSQISQMSTGATYD